MPSNFFHEREEMVRTQILARGIKDQATLDGLLSVPRHLFVPPHLQKYAYFDSPLAIGEGQTISQPYIVALMNQMAELTPDSIVLDVGTGSGYAAAIAAQTAQEVYTIERIPEFSHSAKKLFSKLHYHNIHCKIGDGSLGWSEHAPYDAVIVAASSPDVPPSLLQQLKVGGKLIIPVGNSSGQALVRMCKLRENEFSKQVIEGVRFVPLIGTEGWNVENHQKEDGNEK